MVHLFSRALPSCKYCYCIACAQSPPYAFSNPLLLLKEAKILQEEVDACLGDSSDPTHTDIICVGVFLSLA